MDTGTSGGGWASALINGLGAAIDSQRATPYYAGQPVYYTGAGGVAGQPAASASFAGSSSGLMMLLGLGVVLVLILKK